MVTQSQDTEIGIISGRDAIFLDAVKYEESLRTLTITGDVSGALSSKSNTDEFIGYKITFFDVVAYSSVELESWAGPDFQSSFFEIKDSKWLVDLSSELFDKLIHLVLQTYDDVFEIACVRYEIEFNLS